jgi:hypothetical protein
MVYTKICRTIILKRSISWNITTCSPVKVSRRFGGSCSLHFQGRSVSCTKISMKQAASSRLPHAYMPEDRAFHHHGYIKLKSNSICFLKCGSSYRFHWFLQSSFETFFHMTTSKCAGLYFSVPNRFFKYCFIHFYNLRISNSDFCLKILEQDK